MPVNNALTPEGQNALGAAFGYYPQLRRNRTIQDPRLAAEMPLQFLRGRVAGTLGLPSDVANLVRSPMPMEMFGDVDYGSQTQVPYGSQELLRTLPLPPQGAAQQAAANVGAVIPLTPMEALQAARLARQAALATGKTLGPTAAGMAEGFLQRQGLMPGVLPNNLGGKAATKIDELTGLPLNSDGTVTLFHHTNKSAAEQIAKSGRLKSAGEPSVYLTTQKVTDTGYGDVAVPVRVQPSLLNLDDQFPGGRMDFSIDTGKPKGSIPVTVEKQSFQYPQENAMRLAQQRAALPVEQGGLGLAAGNTAEQRAGAMGFDYNNPVYHATDVDFQSIQPSSRGKMGAGVYVSPSSKYAEKYTGENARVLPLVTRGQLADENVAMDISESIRQKMFAENPDFSVPDWKRQTTRAISDAGYSGQGFSEIGRAHV